MEAGARPDNRPMAADNKTPVATLLTLMANSKPDIAVPAAINPATRISPATPPTTYKSVDSTRN